MMPTALQRFSLDDLDRVYYAEACEPIVAAAREGTIEIQALARDYYHGKPIPDEEIAAVKHLGYWDAKQDQDWGLPWHRNEGIKLAALESGQLAYGLNDTWHTMHPTSLVIARPWQRHKFGNPNITASKLHWLVIDVEGRQPHQKWQWPRWVILSKHDLADLTDFLRHNEQPIWLAKREIIDSFRAMGELAGREDLERIYSSVAIEINQLLLRLLNLFREQAAPLDRELSSVQRSIATFLEQLKTDPVKLRQPWNVKLMAKCCSLGETRFSHYCKEIVNMSPSEYLQHCRLQRAVYLLREENTLTIRQVAEQIGFTTARYFATVFNEHYHCTPQQFREQAG
jgi:AraC family L-rhamnose operon regulatory protein RhaS